MGKPILSIRSLDVAIGGKPVIRGVDLMIREGEVHVLFGPNGSGKSTLLSAIMRLPGYEITGGEILFKDRPIHTETPDAVARMGVGLSFQHPPAIHGVTLGRFLETIDRSDTLPHAVKMLKMESFLERELNTGFSGGELKRAEILKLYAQNPDLLLLDEPESGVDLENIATIAGAINQILEHNTPLRLRKKSGLVITHTGHILDYINADVGHVFMDGKIVCSGTPKQLLQDIRKGGFKGCTACLKEQRRRHETET